MAGYPRDFLSIEQALKAIIKDLKEDRIKEATDKSESFFRKCSDPQDGKNIDHQDSIKLDIASLKEGKGSPMLTAHQDQIEKATKDLKQSEKITNTLIDMGSRIGHLMEVTKDATDPASPGGKGISNYEKEEIYKAVKEVEDKIAALKLTIAKEK